MALENRKALEKIKVFNSAHKNINLSIYSTSDQQWPYAKCLQTQYNDNNKMHEWHDSEPTANHKYITVYTRQCQNWYIHKNNKIFGLSVSLIGHWMVDIEN